MYALSHSLTHSLTQHSVQAPTMITDVDSDRLPGNSKPPPLSLTLTHSLTNTERTEYPQSSLQYYN